MYCIFVLYNENNKTYDKYNNNKKIKINLKKNKYKKKKISELSPMFTLLLKESFFLILIF
jgi:hypothetical protein